MRRFRAIRILGLALAGGVALSAQAIAKDASVKETSAPISISSFSGAFLAAKVAEVDNDLDNAIVYYQRALSFQPDDEGLQQSLMLALISDGKFDQALPYAEKLKTVPEVERFSRLALAIDAIRQKRYDDAQNDLKLVLESDLDRLIVGLVSAWASYGAGDTKEAFAKIDGLDGPEWYGVFKSYHRALIADAAGRKDDAAQSYDEIVNNPAAGGAAPDTYIRAAAAYAAFLARAPGADRTRILGVLDKADEFSPNRPQIAALRADVAAGRKLLPRAASASEGASEVLLDLGAALNRGGGEAFVRLYLQYALALRPDSDAVLFQLAQVSEQQQDAKAAIDFYRLIPAGSPLKRVADLQTGLNLADMDKQKDAIDLLKKLIDASPDDMRAYMALGGVYGAQEDYRDAADLYERAIARIKMPQPADWNLFYQRGIAYERLKEWPKAEPSFRKALELFPNQPQVLNYLGYSWVDMNMNLDEGLNMIRTAVDLRPNDGYIVDSLGWAYFRLGRYDESVTEMERAVSLKPEDPVLNDHLGDAYWRAGRKLDATFQWAHARDLKPEPDLLASVLKKLSVGLPPERPKAAAEIPAKPAEPATGTASPDKKTDAAPAVADPAAKAETTPDATPSPDTADAPAAAPVVKADAAAPAVAQPASYSVRKGQSLWSIADDLLGAGKRYPELIDLNPELKRHPARLQPGQRLKLPEGVTP